MAGENSTPGNTARREREKEHAVPLPRGVWDTNNWTEIIWNNCINQGHVLSLLYHTHTDIYIYTHTHVLLLQSHHRILLQTEIALSPLFPFYFGFQLHFVHIQIQSPLHVFFALFVWVVLLFLQQLVIVK